MSPAEHDQQHKYLEWLLTSDNQHAQQQNNRDHDVQRSAAHQVASDYVASQPACDSFSKDSDAAELLELVQDGVVSSAETQEAEHVVETKSERSFWHRRRRSSHYVSTA